MATFSRTVTVDWSGPIMEGKGVAKAGTGAFSLPVTFPSRVGEPAGTTSPEELMAASHAACYAMALNATLGPQAGERVAHAHHRNGDRRQVRGRHQAAVVQAEGDGGRAEGDRQSQFADVAREAESKCPISNAIRGTMQIDVEADVK